MIGAVEVSAACTSFLTNGRYSATGDGVSCWREHSRAADYRTHYLSDLARRFIQKEYPMSWAQTSVLVICLLGAPGVSLAADAKGDVEKAYAAWDAAFNKQDEKAIGASYVATAKLMPPTHQVASGPAEIEKFFAGLFANDVTGHKLEMVDAAGDDKIVFGTAKWSATGKDKEGKPSPFSGLATHVFERQADGSLKLRLQTFN
nr:nuclear transport factor 2 family protein [Bradyrhizobium japonicum]